MRCSISGNVVPERGEMGEVGAYVTRSGHSRRTLAEMDRRGGKEGGARRVQRTSRVRRCTAAAMAGLSP